MRVFEVASKTACIIACCILLSACSATQVKEGGKELGGKALGHLIILTVFGVDALEEYNEKKYREWYWKTTPYRSSFTRDEYIEMQDKREFVRIYEELRARETHDEEESRDEFSELQDRMEFEHFYQELQARESKDSQDNKR